MIRKLLVLAFLFQSFWMIGQTLDAINLGPVRGEINTYEGNLIWVSQHADSISGRFWTNASGVSFHQEGFEMSRGDTLDFRYSLDLRGRSGDEQIEIRLVDHEGIVLHGFLVELRVIATEEEALETYRNDFFPFKAKEQVFNLGGTFVNRPLSKEFYVYNFGGDSLDLTNLYTNDKSVKVSFVPDRIAHNQFTRMNLSLVADENSELGFTRKPLNIFDSDGDLIAVVPVQFTLEEYYGNHNSSAAQISISKINHDFKVVKKGETREATITIRNLGEADLIVKEVEPNCSCLSYEIGLKEIPPGASTILKVEYDANGRIGYERKTLAIFSNDPKQPTRVLTFRAHVK